MFTYRVRGKGPMEQKEEGLDKASVPLYTKVGWVVVWVVMVVIAAMILRNCATSIIYGVKTGPQAVESYYKSGLRDGRAGQGPNLRGEGAENPVLRKAYNKGYREGVDKER
jgi:hypothetical protein